MSIILPLLCLSHCIIHRKQKQGSSSKLFLFLTLCLLFFIFTHSPNYRLHFRILLSCSSHQPHFFLYPLMQCLYAICPSLLCFSLSRAFFSWTCNCDPKLYLWTFQVRSLHLFVLNNVKLCLFCLLQLLSFLGFGSSLIFAGSWLKIHEWTTF